MYEEVLLWCFEIKRAKYYSENGYNNGIKSSEEILFGLPPTINNISEVNILFYDFNTSNIRGYFGCSSRKIV